MTERKRTIAVVLAAALFFVMLISAFYIAAETDHDCTGEDCRICDRISFFRSTIRTVGGLLASAALVALPQTLCRVRPALMQRKGRRISLVSLKVKLSD